MKTSRSAFTLIELLVVIVIIAILAAIALPVFGRVMERGKGTKDLNNLKQLGTAMLILMNDDDGWLPTNVNEWPKVIVKEKQTLDDTGVFMSAFDPRSQTSGDTFLTSFGINTNMTLPDNRDSSKWKNSSSLIMLAPAPNGGEPGSLQFNNTATSALLSRPASATTPMGTMSNGRLIGVLFSDMHVENVQWGEYIGTGSGTPPTAKYYWNVDGTP